MKMTHRYSPGYLDHWEPKVIKGNPIAPEAKVRITKQKVDPFGKFVFIEDAEGNQQSIYRIALTRLL